MFHVFHLDVAKRSGVAYIAIAAYIRFKCIFHMFQLFSNVCCKCMLQIFQLFQTHVASVSSGCCNDYKGMFQEYTAYVATVRRILQGEETLGRGRGATETPRWRTGGAARDGATARGGARRGGGGARRGREGVLQA
jgi:uncharacterized membrane protein YgcG